MIQPHDYYRTGEWVAEKLSDLKTTFDTITNYAAAKGALVFWRGQANHTWGLTSSLVRKLSGTADLDEDVLGRVEDALLKEASDWVEDLKAAAFATPIAKLAYLQHHEVPTRLLDFSRDPWTATFFAAEAHDQIDGRLFALLVPNDAVLAQVPADTPWRNYAQDEIKIFDPSAHGIVFPRLSAQHGLFAVGRLPSTQPYREAHDPELGDRRRALLAEEVRRVLSIPFALSPLKSMAEAERIPNNAVLPIGLTIRLHVDKASVRRDLAGRSGNRASPAGASTTHKSVYPDVRGMVANSSLLRGLDKGVLVL
jgi:hypothetical protein